MFHRMTCVALLLLSCGTAECSAQSSPEYSAIIAPDHGVVRPLADGSGLVYVGLGDAVDAFDVSINDAAGTSWIHVDVDPLLRENHISCVTWGGPVVTSVASWSLQGSSKSPSDPKPSEPPGATLPVEDGGYAVIIRVDQPGEGGDRDAWEGWILSPDVGHAYIEIVDGNTGESESFGLHPDGFVSPLNPVTDGVILDDSGYESDVEYEIPISQDQYDQLREIITGDQLEPPTYDLNRNNCTDYVLGLLEQIGIPIESTIGTWPGGGGHNPGDLGEDLMEIGGVRTVDSFRDPMMDSSSDPMMDSSSDPMVDSLSDPMMNW